MLVTIRWATDFNHLQELQSHAIAANPWCKRTLDRFILLDQAASRSWVTAWAVSNGKKTRTSGKIWLSRLSCEEAHYRIFFFFFFVVPRDAAGPDLRSADRQNERIKCDDNREMRCAMPFVYRPSSFTRSHPTDDEVWRDSYLSSSIHGWLFINAVQWALDWLRQFVLQFIIQIADNRWTYFQNINTIL